MTSTADAATALLRRLIYAAKRSLQRHPRLYRLAYDAATFNWDVWRQRRAKDRYVSRFGGQWTDRTDFEQILEAKRRQGLVDETSERRLRHWRSEGYLLWEGAIRPELVAAMNQELDRLSEAPPPGLKVTGPRFDGAVPYRPELLRPHASTRIVDHYFFSETAREILLDAELMRFLELVFEGKPVLTQSLGFEFGSEQAVHQDTAFVITNSPLQMVGIWIALEDVQPGSGELVYYPGSHRFPDFLFSGAFKHYDQERDGSAQLAAWFDWIHTTARERGIDLRAFLPKRGDALLWHAGLAHGGAPITRPGCTRRSLVGHYGPVGTRPLYHYYKPAQRKVYEASGFRYSSAYYRR